MTDSPDIARITQDSPYLLEVLNQYSENWEAFLQQYPTKDALPPGFAGYLEQQLSNVTDESEFCRLLRIYKHLAMAHITYRDLYCEQSIEASLQQVSMIADVSIMAAYRYAYAQLEKRYGVPQGEHGQQHLYILGMGKLGGKELNFSSDIDLIFAYPEAGEFSERKKPFEYQQFFIKVAQKLIYLLDHVSADGQVWRVDMRLRPFGDSGPLVMPFSAIEEYYQSQGRSWERYAMLKARILNPQDTSSQILQEILQPFIYRRYVDFSVLDSLREMKRNIAQEYRRRQLSDNIKLGRGGIREVEFLIQCCQLIYGGRHKDLQTPSLKAALNGISQQGLLPVEVTNDLYENYLHLRTVEHRLQQYNNQQTQTLPDNDEQRATLSQQLGFQNWSETYANIQACTNIIHEHFKAFIHDEDSVNEETEDVFSDLWQVSSSADEMLDLCCSMSRDFAEQLLQDKQTAQKWHLGDRGEQILNTLVPMFIEAICKRSAKQQKATWSSIFLLIQAVAKRTAYLELMLENQGAREQILMFCEKSHWVITQLCQFPVLLDELIHPQYLQQTQHDMQAWKEDFSAQLRHAMLRIEPDDVEAQIQTMRQFKLSQTLRIAAADILDYLPIAHVSDKLTLLAEVILARLVYDAWHHVNARYGCLPNTSVDNTGLIIVGYGKLGGIELSYKSDLDIVCLFEGDVDAMTNGKKSLSAIEFYTKLVQRIMHLATTKTLLGDLYELDLRLRPSGNSGLLVSSFAGFKQYQQKDAWVWEHQALLRARPVFGSANGCSTFTDIRKEILSLPRDKDELAKDVLNMRQKMRDHLKDKDKGVMADIEFLTQYWCLCHAHVTPQIMIFSDNLRQLEALAEHEIISSETAQVLTTSYLTWRHHQHHMSIQRDQVHADETLAKLKDEVKSIWDSVFTTHSNS